MSLLKRKRSANWIASEKRLLLDLVTEHFSVIENKKTDGASMKEKLAEWVKISNEYNSQTTLAHRTADNLKAQWESMKKTAKKEAIEDRMEILKTGGGLQDEKTPNQKKEDPIKLRILSLIKTRAVGLCNPFDSDIIIGVPAADSQENLVEFAQKNVIETVPEWETVDEELQGDVKSPIKNAVSLTEPDTQHAHFTMDWGDYTPKKLQTPISSQLRGLKEQSASYKKWSSRRRPHTATSTTSLEEKKIEAITLQIKHAAEEREESKQLNNIRQRIELEQLKQIKIKTRIMLLQLRKEKKNQIQ